MINIKEYEFECVKAHHLLIYELIKIMSNSKHYVKTNRYDEIYNKIVKIIKSLI